MNGIHRQSKFKLQFFLLCVRNKIPSDCIFHSYFFNSPAFNSVGTKITFKCYYIFIEQKHYINPFHFIELK